jgi:transposase InsO family protein
VNEDLVIELVMRQRSHSPKMGGRKLYFLVEADMHRFAPWIGRDKFFDLLRKRSLLVIRRRKYVVTTQSMGSVHQYGDHFNGKQWDCPHQAWVNDITYIRIEDKFMYLFLCTDAFSRKIIGYQLASHSKPGGR